MELQQLEKGESFRFLHDTTNRFRNLRVESTSRSSVTISGEIKDHSVWKPLSPSYAIAPSVEIEKLDSNTLYTVSVIKTEQPKVALRDENYVPGKRGRKPSGIIILFPNDTEFTIKQIAEQHKVHPSIVHIALKKQYPDITPIRKIGSESGRGKPTNVYRIEHKEN